jgi:hypothetical protein
MSNVVQFPYATPLPSEKMKQHENPAAAGGGVFFWIINSVYYVLVTVVGLFMPILEKIMGLFLTFLFIRMLFLWKEPNSHAGWTFCAYLFGWAGLLLFLAKWNPKKRNFSG